MTTDSMMKSAAQLDNEHQIIKHGPIVEIVGASALLGLFGAGVLLAILILAMVGCGGAFGIRPTPMRTVTIVVPGATSGTVTLEREKPTVSGTAQISNGRAVVAGITALPGDGGINVRISVPGYLDYGCVAHLGTSIGNVTWTLGDSPGCAAMLTAIKPPISAGERGAIRVSGTNFVRDDGSPWAWIGGDAYSMFAHWLAGGEAAVDPVVEDYLTCHGLVPCVPPRLFRVFGMVDSFEQIHPKEIPDYYPQMTALTHHLWVKYQVRLEWTLIADAAAVMPSAADRLTHVQRARTALEPEKDHAFIEVGNEPMIAANMPGGEDEAYRLALAITNNGRDCSLPVASGAYTHYDALPAAQDYPHVGPCYATIHTRRDAEWPRGFSDASGIRGIRRIPTVADEGMGAADVDRPGSRSTSAVDAGSAGAFSVLRGNGATAHSDNGLDFAKFTDTQARFAVAMWRAIAFFEPVLTGGIESRGDEAGPCSWAYGPSLVEHRDAVDLRSYGVTQGSIAWVAQSHAPGVPMRPALVLCPGWRIDEAGPGPGMARLVRQ